MTTVDDLTYFGNSKFGTNSGVNEIGSLVQLLISVSVLGHIMSNPVNLKRQEGEGGRWKVGTTGLAGGGKHPHGC
jgi:hypothetical protein